MMKGETKSQELQESFQEAGMRAFSQKRKNGGELEATGNLGTEQARVNWGAKNSVCQHVIIESSQDVEKAQNPAVA